MIIEFKKGQMIITHPSGHVDRYERLDLEKQKVIVQKQIDRLKNDLVYFSNNISNIQKSIGV